MYVYLKCFMKCIIAGSFIFVYIKNPSKQTAFGKWIYCIVLDCVVLYWVCIVLCSIVSILLYCIVLYYVVLGCIVLCWDVLYCVLLYCIVFS